MIRSETTTNTDRPRRGVRRLALVVCGVVLAALIVAWITRSRPEGRPDPSIEFGEPVVLLIVNADGLVLLPNLDALGDEAVLTNQKRVRGYMHRRFREEVTAGRGDHPALVGVIAAKPSPFGKLHPILSAAREAGFTRIQFCSARLTSHEERMAGADRLDGRSPRYWVRVPFSWAFDSPHARCELRVTASPAGAIEEIWLTDRGSDGPPRNLGREPRAGTGSLPRPGSPARLEIDPRLHSVHVVEVLGMMSDADIGEIVLALPPTEP